MKYSRNIIATVLISLFILNGVCSVIPKLFSGCHNAIEKLYSTESETEKKETNERAVSEIKELYVNNSYPSDLFIIYLNTTEKNNTLSEILLRDDIHISIPTPPPENA
jgi:hypothetical protein